MLKIRTLLFAGLASLFALPATAFETTAKQAVIMDYDSGQILFRKNADTPMIPASMTKIMTVYMVFERLSDGRLSPDDTFTVSENAWRKGGASTEGSTMFLPIGQQVSIRDLLRGVIVQSGNDACIVLAEGIAGSEEAFAAEMTTRAHELGLATASFKNATGLHEDGHEISAEDLAKLARMTIENFPDLYQIYAEREFTWSDIRQFNRNPLLSRFSGTDGLKTGHLSQSGYGLTASAQVDGERRIVVVNGLESERDRANEAERMMRAAFREFSVATPFEAGTIVAEAPVWLGAQSTVPLEIQSDLNLAYPSADRNRVTAEVVLSESIKAPVEQGAILGELLVSLEDEELARLPVYAAEPVSKLGIVGQAMEGLSAMIVPPASAGASALVLPE
ncbi:MAG: D-alanyl-D-alanine carboxypeptidase [Ponticaulis sp.]|nr:D-alanyl-D-alanine carboxypeptidase [Ponticaulis sp.]